MAELRLSVFPGVFAGVVGGRLNGVAMVRERGRYLKSAQQTLGR